ncbi:MAG: phenylalanine 4-monooxygenase, partial [Daejeonella sp.]
MLKAVECKSVSTAVYSSGLQVTGMFTDLGISTDNALTFLKTTGPSALAVNNKQLEGHSKNYHKDGFSSPVGKLKGFETALENFTDEDLIKANIVNDQETELNFASGINLKGKVQEIKRFSNKIILISFINCTVTGQDGTLLFDPSWGVYDMAVGEKVVSVFCGAADKDAYQEIALISKTTTYHHQYSDKTLEYHQLFKTVRDCRENQSGYEKLEQVWNSLKTKFRDDWLCSMEILEILEQEELSPNVCKEIRIHLEMIAAQEPEYAKLISDGFYLIKNPVSQLTV